jgi:putative transcription factor
MCGSENHLFKARIEGSLLNVCQKCAKFGKVLASVQDPKLIAKVQKKQQTLQKTAPISEKEITESLVENWNDLIKKKRESLNLTQEEFAKKINEKESIIHKIETGSFEPNISLARKLEKFLKIKLVEQGTAQEEVPGATKSEEFTLGDFIKVR